MRPNKKRSNNSALRLLNYIIPLNPLQNPLSSAKAPNAGEKSIRFFHIEPIAYLFSVLQPKLAESYRLFASLRT
jgi:hypothetical protein